MRLKLTLILLFQKLFTGLLIIVLMYSDYSCGYLMFTYKKNRHTFLCCGFLFLKISVCINNLYACWLHKRFSVRMLYATTVLHRL